MRSIFNVSSIIITLLFQFTSYASEERIAVLRPGGFSKDVMPLPLSEKIQKSKFNTQTKPSNPNWMIDTLTWRCDWASDLVNIGFLNQGDSALVWFDPPKPCSLLAIRFKPHNWEGNLLIDIWNADNYYPLICSMDSTDSNGWIGTYCCGWPDPWIPGDVILHSPLGWNAHDQEHHLWGPFPYTVTAAHNDVWIEIPASAGIQRQVYLGSDPFYIGAAFYITSGWGFYAQEPYPGSTPYSFFKFYSAGEGPGPHDGWYIRSFQLWFEAVVKCNNTPLCGIWTQTHNCTYTSGPFPTKAVPSCYCPGSVFKLVYEINGITESVEMTIMDGDTLIAVIPELSIGDVVEYWVDAVDNKDCHFFSHKKTLQRLHPEHPDADILLIWNYRGDSDLDSFLVDLFSGFDTMFEYELWNIPERNGIDESVINWGWNTIYLSGWGSGNTLPGHEYEGNIFADWLEHGTVKEPHNLLYSDQDYFCVQNGYGCDWDKELTEGDFLYDYFGVRLAISDNSGADTPGYDSVAIGQGDFDGIEVNFMPDAWDPTDPERNLWPDWIVELANDAEQIFYYQDHPEYGAGVRTDRGHYKTVYLPWQDFFAVDSLENGDLISRQGLTKTIEKILEWFVAKTAVHHTESESSLPIQCRLIQNVPNPFNVHTDIRYQTVDSRFPSPISLKIYNILGREVTTLVDEMQEAGTHTVRWDGRDNFGKDIGSGIYFYQLKAGDFIDTKRMLLLK